jgi:hypothetical protein
VFGEISQALFSKTLMQNASFRPINAYAKRDERATYLFFEEVLNSKRNKVLRGRTFYKIIKPLDMENFEKIITMNGITDLTGVIKIATGGHPGGEA